MRVFNTFTESRNEIGRDLNELGVSIFAGYQSKEVNPMEHVDLWTKELTDYDYIVLQPRLLDLRPTQPWANQEWDERLAGIEMHPTPNPGKAWKARSDLWESLREKGTGRFSYTYSERLAANRLPFMLEDLRKHMTSRQIWISIWDPNKDAPRIGKKRVPCSLGYQITVRAGKVNIAYHMRSSDYATHFENDIYLACKLQEWFSQGLRIPIGTFTHKLGSLHVYAADVAHIF